MKFLFRLKADLRDANRTGADLISKLKLFLLLLFRSSKFKFIFKKNLNLKLRLKKFNQEFEVLLPDRSSLMVLHEIFIKDEYNLEIDNLNVIVDLGSNIGLSLIYFKLKYPNSKIFGFEPDSATFNILKENVRQFNNIFVFNVAISNRSGKEKFYSNLNSSMSSSLLRRNQTDKVREIETKTLDQIIVEIVKDDVDLLKFDVEGYEFKIFSTFVNWNKVKYLIGELHLDLILESKDDFLKLFKNYQIKTADTSQDRSIIFAKHNENI